MPSLSSSQRASSSAWRLVAMTPAVPAPKTTELPVVWAVAPVAPLRMLAVSLGEFPSMPPGWSCGCAACG